MTDVKMYRLANGDEIVATVVSESDTTVEIKDAVALVFHPNEQGQVSTGFAPFMPYSEGGITIFKHAVSCTSNVQEKMLGEYNRIFGKIQVAPASILAGLK